MKNKVYCFKTAVDVKILLKEGSFDGSEYTPPIYLEIPKSKQFGVDTSNEVLLKLIEWKIKTGHYTEKFGNGELPKDFNIYSWTFSNKKVSNSDTDTVIYYKEEIMETFFWEKIVGLVFSNAIFLITKLEATCFVLRNEPVLLDYELYEVVDYNKDAHTVSFVLKNGMQLKTGKQYSYVFEKNGLMDLKINSSYHVFYREDFPGILFREKISTYSW